MKTRFFVVVLMVAVVGFGSCGGKDKEKSDNNNITKFVVNNVEYKDIQANGDILHIYEKTGANTWSGMPNASATAQITLSDDKAKTDPASVTLDFSQVEIGKASVVGSFDVIAENGKAKTYTVKVTKNNNEY